ncbi:hypothetical protein [Marimonas arenosa]|uniref:Uncharacterized protein n=1 Tax=Marimonas arenosa TaxID=1795305 RepID=A0AAE3WDY1_9RHOB|nr:hypothetical protein [Marimonas arenosa]MDQ2090942.1 hypothetical protein [Marimonas arenosa]
MRTRMFLFLASQFLCLVLAPAALAQTVLSGNHSVDGHLCAGQGCTGSESFIYEALKLKSSDTSIVFEDTSTGQGASTRDWKIEVNDVWSDSEYFAVKSHAKTVFRVDADAPYYALKISDNGNVGLGTFLPQADLHVMSGSTPTIKLEQDGSNGNAPYEWDIFGSEVGFGIRTWDGGLKVPFLIQAGAPQNALTILDDGDIGLGFGSPTAALHLRRDDGTATFMVQETDATTVPRTMMNLQNNGRPELVMGNTATDGEWSIGAGSNLVMKRGVVGSRSPAKTRFFMLDGTTGDLEITGQLITGGPTCEKGCDAVFSDDYDLPSIEEHADQMFALGHLPAIGPTVPDAPINISERHGQMLNELEHAHIYIAQLESQIRRIPDLEARLAALEAAVRDSTER